MPKLVYKSYPDVYRQLADMSDWHWEVPMTFSSFCEFVFDQHTAEVYADINDGAVQLVALFSDYCAMSLDGDDTETTQATPPTYN